MTNPNNAVGTNAAFGGRTSVNAFNDVLAKFVQAGIVSGWVAAADSGMTITVGASDSTVRDVAIAEDPYGNRTTVNNRAAQPIPVTISDADADDSRIDAVVAYVDSPAEVSSTESDNPSICGLISVDGTSGSAPDDEAIRTAITADGGTGTDAYYVVLATVAVGAGVTAISGSDITAGESASPSVNDGRTDFTLNGNAVGYITANQSEDKTINFQTPIMVGSLLTMTFDAGFVGGTWTVTGGDESYSGTIDNTLTAEVVIRKTNTAYRVSAISEDEGVSATQVVSTQYYGSVEVNLPYSENGILVLAEADGTMNIKNRWTTPITARNTDTGVTVTISGSSNSLQGSSLTVSSGDIIEVTESTVGTTFRDWSSKTVSSESATDANAFISNVQASIISMPTMSLFTTDESGTTAGAYFFSYFNSYGTLTSLPDGSFDTSSITTVGGYFFNAFNFNGTLTSLPAGSFDISSVTTVGGYFFNGFNRAGSLTSLPAGSFDTSNITTVGDFFFGSFNYDGTLASLPDESFNISSITTVGNSFIVSFNYSGSLTSLPAGSFDTSNITTVGNSFFTSFNGSGALTSLPAGSFDTSNITTVGNFFFGSFNRGGVLTSLPAGSFDTSNITTHGSSSFLEFNYNGYITKDTTSGGHNKDFVALETTYAYYSPDGESGSTSSVTVSAGSKFYYNQV